MADVTIKGQEIEFDLSKMSMKEWREMRTPAFSEGNEDELLARISGQPLEFIQGLNAFDFKKLFDALLNKMRMPLANPNSASASG